MKTITMGPGGKLTIPLEIWEQIGVKPGDFVEMSVKKSGVLEVRKYQGEMDDQVDSNHVENRQDAQE